MSTILLPIVGNAAEHASAVLFACRDKMDLAVAVAVGSATQITLLGVPFAVLVAWGCEQPLSLDMHPFEGAVLLTAVVGTALVIADGRSTWLKGAALVLWYVALAAAFCHHHEDSGPRAPSSAAAAGIGVAGSSVHEATVAGLARGGGVDHRHHQHQRHRHHEVGLRSRRAHHDPF